MPKIEHDKHDEIIITPNRVYLGATTWAGALLLLQDHEKTRYVNGTSIVVDMSNPPGRAHGYQMSACESRHVHIDLSVREETGVCIVHLVAAYAWGLACDRDNWLAHLPKKVLLIIALTDCVDVLRDRCEPEFIDWLLPRISKSAMEWFREAEHNEDYNAPKTEVES